MLMNYSFQAKYFMGSRFLGLGALIPCFLSLQSHKDRRDTIEIRMLFCKKTLPNNMQNLPAI